MLTDYQLRLPQFEGPLDVLLRLIERSQLAITDLSLMVVTEQFLAHVHALDESAPPQVLAEFTVVGARLTLLKSRSLLPRPPVEDVAEDPSDLARQLEEYRQFKQVAGHLSARLATGVGSYGPEVARVPWHDPQPARLVDYEPAILVRLIRRRLSALPRPTTFLRQRPIVTLPQLVERIVTLLHRQPSLPFRTVLETCHNRSEAATAFLAMLVLHRRQAISATQSELFGDIHLQPRPEASGLAMDESGPDADDVFAPTAAAGVLAGVGT